MWKVKDISRVVNEVENEPFTIIHSNGSKWFGESPDEIEKLVEMLEQHTLEKRFFFRMAVNDEDGNRQMKGVTPIISEPGWLRPFDEIYPEGTHVFTGNFEKVSHVFRVTTNDCELIELLTEKIKANPGWEKYSHLAKAD